MLFCNFSFLLFYPFYLILCYFTNFLLFLLSYPFCYFYFCYFTPFMLFYVIFSYVIYCFLMLFYPFYVIFTLSCYFYHLSYHLRLKENSMSPLTIHSCVLCEALMCTLIPRSFIIHKCLCFTRSKDDKHSFIFVIKKEILLQHVGPLNN